MSFKMCLIGCGSLAYWSHSLAYVKYRESHPDFVMAACCDLDAAKAEKMKSDRGFARAYTDLHEMMTAEKPDAVCVIVPVGATASVVLQALEYGVPLMTEKPPGMTSADTKRLIEAAERKNVPTHVAFNRRFIPLVTEYKKWAAEAGGKILYIRYDMQRNGRKETDFSDTAVHGIDAVRHIAGLDYAKIRFTHQPLPINGLKHVYMEAVMGENTVAHLNFSPVSGIGLERAAIHMTDRTFFINLPLGGYDKPGTLVEVLNGKTVRSVTSSDVGGDDDFVTSGFYAENEYFFDRVRDGLPLEHNLKNSLQSVIVMEQYRRNAEFWTAG